MQELPSEILYHVLGQLDQRSRMAVIPLVCRKWRALAERPDCPLYETLRVYDNVHRQEIGHFTKVLSWTRRHGAAVLHLHISTNDGRQLFALYSAEPFPLWENLPNLMTLSITSGIRHGIINFDVHDLQHLHWADHCKNLRHIILSGNAGYLPAHHIDQLLNFLAKLARLEGFHLSISNVGAQVAAPQLEVVAHLTQLSQLCLPCLDIVPGNHLSTSTANPQGLERLTGLTQLALGQLNTMPVSLAALQSLRQLMLGHIMNGCHELPADLRRCTQLSYLQLSDWSMPAERAWQNLSATLQTLASLRCLVLKGMSFSPAFHRIHWRIPRQVTALSITQSSKSGAYFPHDLVNHPSLESLELSLDTLDTLPTGRYLSTLQLLSLRDIAADNFLAGTSIRNALPQATALRYLLLEEGRKGKGNIAFQEAEAGLRARMADGDPAYRIMRMPHCVNQQDPHIELQGTDACLWPFRDFDWEARGMRSRIFRTCADEDL
ncbi:hypothetical protein WJX74_004872 [Apatococcus lobatus]|uniref:F-box domain-containing protein n=1 Tax=Apatococcus lobatus TaxID=904363 RepID=A0AAW1QJL9_9CHLO